MFDKDMCNLDVMSDAMDVALSKNCEGVVVVTITRNITDMGKMADKYDVIHGENLSAKDVTSLLSGAIMAINDSPSYPDDLEDGDD